MGIKKKNVAMKEIERENKQRRKREIEKEIRKQNIVNKRGFKI